MPAQNASALRLAEGKGARPGFERVSPDCLSDRRWLGEMLD